MDRRLQLHEILCDILGSRNVYFQPTSNTKMSYPAIIYKRDWLANEHADNSSYVQTKRYLITAVGDDPDWDVPDKISRLPMTAFDRYYPANGLNHDSYKTYF